jgi:uncharacterized protein (TIGR02145 family)
MDTMRVCVNVDDVMAVPAFENAPNLFDAVFVPPPPPPNRRNGVILQRVTRFFFNFFITQFYKKSIYFYINPTRRAHFGYAQCALFAHAKTPSARICQNYPVPPYSKDFQMKRFAILFAALFGAVGAFAQNDTAYVPFVVNVAATVTAVPDVGTTAVVTQVQMTVMANTPNTLKIPLPKTNGVLSGAQRQASVPALISNGGGKVTLNLPAQSYKNAEIALYAVNGKRILRKNVSASSAANAISRQNAAPGAYMLSVTGADGGAFTSRLTHNGGSLGVNVIFGGENHSQRLAKETGGVDPPPDNGGGTSDGNWTVTVSASGYVDRVYTFKPIKGTNQQQNVTLSTASGGGGDGSGDAVTIGGKKWMKKNLNVQTSDSRCFENSADSCAKYGRLYTWEDAKSACRSAGSGWRLPDSVDWTKLVVAAGGSSVAGKKLKATSGWQSGSWCANCCVQGNCNGTDDYGFSALPGGYYYTYTYSDSFTGESKTTENFLGGGAAWWTATEYGQPVTSGTRIVEVDWVGNISLSAYGACGFSGQCHWLSVRCVKD